MKTLIIKVLISLLLAIYLSVNIYAQVPEESPTLIKFSKNSHTVVLQGKVLPQSQKIYLLNIKKGQKVNIKITQLPGSEINPIFDIKDPDGEPLPEAEFDAYFKYSGRLAKGGNYQIIVLPVGLDSRYYKPASTKYRLVIKVY